MENRPENSAEQESRRILSNLQGQEGHLFARAAHRLESHLNAADADAADRIEVIGTRVGRIISLTVTLIVIVWALVWLFAS